MKKFFEGKKTIISAVLLLLGGGGLLLSGQTEEGIAMILAALTAFGLGDKVDRLSKQLNDVSDSDKDK